MLYVERTYDGYDGGHEGSDEEGEHLIYEGRGVRERFA
jgi:hypothetical protein